MQPETDESLMKAVARKDTSALRELMRRHEARVRRLACRFAGSDAAAADLVQEVFFKVYTSAGSYRPKARFTTWLYRITANHCLNYIRSSKKNPLQQLADPLEEAGPKAPVATAGTQLSDLEKKERALLVRQAVDSLPERQRMAILLLRFEGMTYREAAQALSCSVSALEALVYRGFETLKKRLAYMHEGE